MKTLVAASSIPDKMMIMMMMMNNERGKRKRPKQDNRVKGTSPFLHHFARADPGRRRTLLLIIYKARKDEGNCLISSRDSDSLGDGSDDLSFSSVMARK